MSGLIQNLPGADVSAPITGGVLGVTWLGLQTISANATPVPVLPQVFLAEREIASVEPPSAPQIQSTSLPSPSPTTVIGPTPTLTPPISQQPTPAQSGLSPLVLGAGLAALIVIAIFIGILVQGKGR